MDVQMLEPLKAGDRVIVCVAEHLGWKAVILAYVLPMLVMVAIIATMDAIGISEVIAGTVALAGPCLYFLLLRLFNKRLQREFSFTAKKDI